MLTPGVFISAVSDVYKVVEFGFNLAGASGEARAVGLRLQTIQQDLNELRRLYNDPRMVLDAAERASVRRVITNAVVAIDRVARPVERSRVDERIYGTVTIVRRINWILRDAATVKLHEQHLSICYTALSRELAHLQSVLHREKEKRAERRRGQRTNVFEEDDDDDDNDDDEPFVYNDLATKASSLQALDGETLQDEESWKEWLGDGQQKQKQKQQQQPAGSGGGGGGGGGRPLKRKHRSASLNDDDSANNMAWLRGEHFRRSLQREHLSQSPHPTGGGPTHQMAWLGDEHRRRSNRGAGSSPTGGGGGGRTEAVDQTGDS